MNNKYGYLKQYMGGQSKEEPITVWDHNVFHPVSNEEIMAAENKLGFSFPQQLKEFYLAIGEGYLTTPQYPEDGYRFSGANDILPPLVSAAFYKPVEGDDRPEDEYVPIDSGDGEHYMAAMTYEIIQPGDLPFFEISDSTRFLVMRPHSENPNAVWTSSGIKIEDSFEKFIWRLYYEDPAYYDDIIDAYYQTSES